MSKGRSWFDGLTTNGAHHFYFHDSMVGNRPWGVCPENTAWVVEGPLTRHESSRKVLPEDFRPLWCRWQIGMGDCESGQGAVQ
ncbi:MAG: hypothetical protein SVO26_07810, partial [Chloroflexota bacterium]|nr:hypothetical protein [Chloroflexota bacterium]